MVSKMAMTLSDHQNTDVSAAQRLLTSLQDLESYYQSRGLDGHELTLAEVSFARSLACYRLAPPPGKMIDQRLHVMVFGGAGAGKSSVANILTGAAVAEVNAQAGYTRHPVAYLRSDTQDPNELWPPALGRLERYDGIAPGNIDADRFAWRQLTDQVTDPGFLRRHVVWDNPDLTAKDASYYQYRVLEIAGLAHVGVYVASDERYNDELPTNFLQGMLEAGKWVVVALTKVSTLDADELIGLFRRQVVSRLKYRERILAVLAIPAPPPGKLHQLWTDEFPHGDRLREAVEQATADFATAQQQARQAAAEHLHRLRVRLLEPLEADLGEWRAWTESVRQSANQVVLRYDHEYLARIHYQELQDTLSRMLEVFQLPGVFRYLWQGLEVLRTPYRWAKSYWRRFIPRITPEPVDEDQALDKVCQSMLESLRVTCAARRSRHPLWSQLRDALAAQAPHLIGPAYQQTRERQRRQIHERLQNTTREIQTGLVDRPVVRGALQLLRALIDLTALGGAVYLAGASFLLLLLPPLAVGLVDDFFCLVCQFYVNRQRREVRRQQKENIRELVQLAYIDPILQLPAETGPRLYALAELAKRLPSELDAALAEAGGEAER